MHCDTPTLLHPAGLHDPSPGDLHTGTVTPEDARLWIESVDALAGGPRRPRASLSGGSFLLSAAQAEDLARHLPEVEWHCPLCGWVDVCVHVRDQAVGLRRQMFECVVRWGRRSGQMLANFS